MESKLQGFNFFAFSNNSVKVIEVKETDKRCDPNISVLNVKVWKTDNYPISCGYCHSSTPTKAKFLMRSTKLSTDHYEYMVEKGFVKSSGSGISLYSNEKSWCKIFNPRVDVDQFTISKEQKKHMRRFNQIMNGEREFKIKQENVEILSEKRIIANYNFLKIYK